MEGVQLGGRSRGRFRTIPGTRTDYGRLRNLGEEEEKKHGTSLIIGDFSWAAGAAKGEI